VAHRKEGALNFRNYSYTDAAYHLRNLKEETSVNVVIGAPEEGALNFRNYSYTDAAYHLRN
jgi:hypothetical protein